MSEGNILGFARRRHFLLASTLLDTSLKISGGGAAAQTAGETDPPTATSSPNVSAEEVSEGEIVVTGSRIARHDLTSPSPTAIVTGDDIKLSGNVTIESTLYEYGRPIEWLGDVKARNARNAVVAPRIDISPSFHG